MALPVTVGSISDSHANAAARLPDVAHLGQSEWLSNTQLQDLGHSIPVAKAHQGARAAAAADFAADRTKDEFARIADFTAGGSAQPPAGWRQAGTSELSALGLRSDAISNLTGGQFARVFTTGAGENQRIAVQFTEQSGHWQKWLQAGGHGLGPATAHATQQQQFVQGLEQANNIDVTVIPSGGVRPETISAGVELHSDLKWQNPHPGALAYIQDSGRQATSDMTIFR